MITFKGHFDGKVIVPDEPVDLPKGSRIAFSLDGSEMDRPENPMTAEELAKSPFVGLWANRSDIRDSLEFASQLRERSNRRR